MAAIFPNQVVATGACAYHSAVPQEHVDGVPSNEVGAGDEEPQNDTNSPYQNSEDDKFRLDSSRHVECTARVNVTNVTTSSHAICKKSARPRKCNDNTREELLEVVKDMCYELREDIHSSKESLLSNNTVNKPSEASIILSSLMDMGIDPRTRVHAFEKIVKDNDWRGVWSTINEPMRRAFINDIVNML